MVIGMLYSMQNTVVLNIPLSFILHIKVQQLILIIIKELKILMIRMIWAMLSINIK